MKNTLLIVLLTTVFAGCAGDKAPASQTPGDSAQPVGSTGAVSADTKLSDNAAPPAAAESAASRAAAETATPKPETPDVPTVDPGPSAGAEPEYREVTIPAGTLLPLQLTSSVGSDTSSVEDPVRATLRRAITVNGVRVLPAGSVVTGHVTDATRSARVKGRARVAFRFNAIDPKGSGGPMAIRTNTITRIAPGTKKRDAAKIGGGAAGGAIVGGLLGGGDGAAKGAAIGGGAGTAVVLSTRGKEIRVPAGAALSVKLTAPLRVRVPMS